MAEGSSIFTVLFWLLLTFSIFALGLNTIVGTGVSVAFATSSLTGLEAFVIWNLGFWIILGLIIWALWVTR